MLISKYFGIKILVLFLVKASASNLPCNWKSDVDCWLLCTSGTTSDVLHSIEERWIERSQCHADGIALGLFNIIYTKLTVKANWFIAKVKVKYLEFGMGQVNEIEDDAFNADAFKSVKHLVFATMDLPVLKKGLLNGLVSLEILNLKDTSLIRSVDMGIIDGIHETLKQCTIERSYASTHLDDNERHPLPINSFGGSQQTSNLEFMKIRYYVHRLTSNSFVALKNIRHLDLSNCRIAYIEDGTFDTIVSTVKVIRLIDNPFKQLPAGMFDLIPLRYSTFIFVGKHQTECQCDNFPFNLIVKVRCGFELDDCNSIQLTNRTTTNVIPTITSTTVSAAYTKDDVLVGASKSLTNKFSTIDTPPPNLIAAKGEIVLASSSTAVELTVPPSTTESTVNKINESSKLTSTEPQEQSYFQYLSKHMYLLMVGVVTIILSLLLFLVWFNCFKKRRLSSRSQTDFDLVLL